MIGWEELSRMVGETFQKLTPEQQSRCVIMANNYGTKYDMPPVISYNDSYIFWDPVYYCSDPKTDINLVYQEELQNRLERYHND